MARYACYVLIAVPVDCEFELLCKTDVPSAIRSVCTNSGQSGNERDLHRVVEFLRTSAAGLGSKLPSAELLSLIRTIGGLHASPQTRPRAAGMLRTVLCTVIAQNISAVSIPTPALVASIIELVQRDGWPALSDIVDDFCAALKASSLRSIDIQACLATELHRIGVDSGRKIKVASFGTFDFAACVFLSI